MLAHPWYAAIVIIHILAAVVGFAALGMTGSYARLARRSADPFASESLRRFFQPGRNIAARAILLVPVFGGIALGFSHDLHRWFPYLGIGIWVIATGIASGMLWPAEARIQQIFVGDVADGEALSAAATRCERAAAMTSICFVLALIVMIAQPN